MDNPMRTPMISVLMPVYNAEKFLREAIDSILGQTYTDFELIIINDGSFDQSRNIIYSYNDKRIKIIENEKNSGLIFSLNRAIDNASGKYIARMDADDISMPDRFEKQITFLESHSDIALLGSSAIIIDESGKEKKVANVIEASHLIFTQLFFESPFFHPSVMGRTSVFREFRYNDNYYLAEDYYLWSQIAMKYKLSNLNEPLIKYRHHTESISRCKAQQQQDCVKKIYAFHLANLGVENITGEQLQCHYNIMVHNPAYYSAPGALDALKWLKYLYKKNVDLKIYDQKLFQKNLLVCWRENFSLALTCTNGYRAIPFVFGKFNKEINLKQKFLFIIYCLRYTWPFDQLFNRCRVIKNKLKSSK